MADPAGRLIAALADHYRLERELGVGGMATVYLADDVKHHRKVALKVFRPELAASLGPDRFAREIEIAARLTHPHILSVHDSGQADGFLYYVMPYVDGESLRDRLNRSGPLPISEAVRILRDVADALAYAHQQGVIHRDIKPENVMLAGRHALVADFGVAKAVRDATGGGRLTTAGIALGTPTYMAPEQAAADPATDHRADLYAFGVLAYELLTGRPPFVGASPQEVLAAHVTTAPASITRHRPDLPGPLASLVMKCLAKKPSDRWQTAGELLPALESMMTPGGGSAPVSSGRRWLVWAGATVVGLAVLSGFGWWRWHARGLAPNSGGLPRSVAVLPLSNLSGRQEDEYFVDGLTEELMGALGKVPGLRVAGRTSSFAFKGQNPTAREIADRLGVESILSGSAQRAGDRVRLRVQLVSTSDGLTLWSESYQGELKDVFALQDSITRAMVDALRLTLSGEHLAASRAAATTNPAAHDLYLRGLAFANTFSEDGLVRAIDLFGRAAALDATYAQPHAAAMVAWGNLSDAYRAPRSIEDHARTEAHAAVRLNDLAADSHMASAMVLAFFDWNFPAGEREFQRSLELDPNSILALTQFAIFSCAMGKPAVAFALGERAARLDPLSAIPSVIREWALVGAGKYDQVVAAHRHTLTLDAHFFYHDDMAAVAFRAEGKFAEALAEYEQPHAKESGQPLYGKAVTLARAGRTSEARALLDEILALRARRYVSGDKIAAIYASLGEADRAFEWLQRAYDDRAGEMLFFLGLDGWPDFNPIRRDPRFAALKKKIGLPEATQQSPSGSP